MMNNFGIHLAAYFCADHLLDHGNDNIGGNVFCAGVIYANGYNSEAYIAIIFLHKEGSVNTWFW
jgi:hypothetical protein